MLTVNLLNEHKIPNKYSSPLNLFTTKLWTDPLRKSKLEYCFPCFTFENLSDSTINIIIITSYHNLYHFHSSHYLELTSFYNIIHHLQVLR